MMKVEKQPTWTFKTQQALRDADDFMSFEQLRERTGASHNQLTASLHHLKKSRVVDAMDAEGHLWWYLTGEDTRSMSLDERTPEPKGNRVRRQRVKPANASKSKKGE